MNLADSGKNRNDIKSRYIRTHLQPSPPKPTTGNEMAPSRSLEAGFTRYSVVFTGEELPDGRKADAVYIILSDIYMQVINGAMTRPLDYDYLKSLSPAPQRFYELLSYQIYAALKYDRPRAKLIYSEFCAYAPQIRHSDWDGPEPDEQDSPAAQEIRLYRRDRLSADGRRRRPPDWIMLYVPGPKARAEYRAFTTPRRAGRARGRAVAAHADPRPWSPPSGRRRWRRS